MLHEWIICTVEYILGFAVNICEYIIRMFQLSAKDPRSGICCCVTSSRTDDVLVHSNAEWKAHLREFIVEKFENSRGKCAFYMQKTFDFSEVIMSKVRAAGHPPRERQLGAKLYVELLSCERAQTSVHLYLGYG